MYVHLRGKVFSELSQVIFQVIHSLHLMFHGAHRPSVWDFRNLQVNQNFDLAEVESTKWYCNFSCLEISPNGFATTCGMGHQVT